MSESAHDQAATAQRLTRRELFRLSAQAAAMVGGWWIAGRTRAVAAPGVVLVWATANEAGSEVFFDPIGLHIQPGQTVRWVLGRSYHTTTAYHPQNDNHELRIPQNAIPWDSGVLTGEPGRQSFEYRFEVPGVYDYYCAPHEHAGMVGRIVVGDPGDGPGTRPFGWAPEKGWRPVPAIAQANFPSIEEILARGVVRRA
ncbi:MAG TPA: plastocyanin/azurin family copper-binding protein [Limnochordia bacterium]